MDSSSDHPIRSTVLFPRWLGILCTASCFAAASVAYAASEPSLITGEKKSYGYSWQQEMKLGAEADREMSEEMGLYNEPKLQAYVEAVGQRVLSQSDFASPNAPEIYRNTKFTFRVMDSPVVNAFALPGGYVYVTRGLLSHVQNEAQLAVVLGHEIAHVAARHSSQQARRSQWTQLGVIAGAILGSKVLGERGADLAPTLLNVGGQAAQMFLLRYSREAEHESDTLGVNYAARAGYAADQSARFFQSLQRLSANEGKALPTWKSSHPDPGDRASRVVNITAQIPPESRTNVGEEQYLKHIEGMIVGENPREGFVANGVFYHPELRFQLPVAQGWQVDNQKAAVLMGAPNGNAMMGLRLAAGARARDAAMQFAQQSKVKVVTSGDTQVNGLPTTVIIGQADTEQGAVGVWNAFIEYNGRVYSLLGYAPQNAFEQMRPTFESVAAGFSPLRNEAVTAVQPARLKLVRVDRNAPFASFVPASLPHGMTAEEVAIMNQVALNEPVVEGRVLKLPDGAQNVQNLAAVAAPVASSYPTNSQPAPAQTYPTTTYPAQNYPSQTYPPQNYPAQNYPQTTPAYPPATTYPQQSGQASTYPPQNQPAQGYPSQSYPQQPGYPSQGYPQQNYPANTYPQNQPYPPQSSTNYPSSPPNSSNYPSQSGNYPTQSPPTNYPQYPSSGTPYPQSGYPQFPQPPSSNPQQTQQTPQRQQPQAPVWPR